MIEHQSGEESGNEVNAESGGERYDHDEESEESGLNVVIGKRES